MKEYIGSACNFMLVPSAVEAGEEDCIGIAPTVEIIIITSELTYQGSIGGITKTRDVDSVRVGFSPRGMREFAKYLNERADEIEKVAEYFVKASSGAVFTTKKAE